jgi:hypothetical protein
MTNMLAAPESGIAAPTPTAREQQAMLNRRRAELIERRARNIGALTEATLSGASSMELDAERRRISDSLENLELAEAKLRPKVLLEERKQLLLELDAALSKQRDINEHVTAQVKVVEKAQAALNEAVFEVERLKRMSGGQFAAALRLSRHREAHPDITEGEIA